MHVTLLAACEDLRSDQKVPRSTWWLVATRREDGQAMDAATGTSGTNDPDWTVVRDFIRDLKIACDDLHAEPFNPQARDTVLRLLQKGSPAADSALERVARARQDPDAGHLRLLSDR